MKKLLIFLFSFLMNAYVFAGDYQIGESNNFNTDWKFYLGEQADFMSPDFNDSQWRSLELPHDWSIEGEFSVSNPSGESGAYLPNGIACYRKTFQIQDELKGKRIKIRFDGVYMNSTVYINGVYLGNRPYGFSSFEYDLTPHLRFDNQDNVIAVKVDNSLQPGCRWYTGSGINRNVYLQVKEQQYFSPKATFFSTEKLTENRAEVKLELKIISHNFKESQIIAFQPDPDNLPRIEKSAHIISELIDTDGKVVSMAEATELLKDYSELACELSMKIEKPHLWSDKSPYLYTLNNRLIIEGKVMDTQSIKVGIRKIDFNAESGMLVNGEKTILKGVCLHKDAGSFGTAVPCDIWRYRLTKLKAMGCNAIRTHGPVDPQFIDVCDEMGFYMMVEAFDEWNLTWKLGFSENPEGKRPYSYHLYFNQWAETDLKDMVYRDRNHASVFMYSVGNEVPDQRSLKGPEKLSRLMSWAKEVDDTRPVVVACDWPLFANKTGFMDTMDVAGYNYIDRYFPGLYSEEHAAHPDRILLGTETYPDLQNWLSVRDNQYVAGEFLWVGIDYLGEALSWPRRGWEWGLIDIAGFEKTHYYIRQSYWSDKPMVHIAVNTKEKDNFRWKCFNVTSHWNFEKDEVDTVYVYSNCEEVELFLNRKSLGKKKVDKDSYYAMYRVKYKKGSLKAIGLNNSQKVANHELITAEGPIKLKIIPEKDSVNLNSGELVYLSVEIQDKHGVRCPEATNNIRVKVEGAGVLIGMDSGNQFSHEKYKINNRDAYEGRILVTIKPLKSGLIKLSVDADDVVSERSVIVVN